MRDREANSPERNKTRANDVVSVWTVFEVMVLI